MNSKDGLNYEKLKSVLRGSKLQNAKRSHFEGLVNDKKGVKQALLSSINSGKCISFEDLLFELN